MKRETVQRHLLKMIAIFFSVSLWFYVLNSEPIQIEKKLPINYIFPKGHSMASFSEQEVVLKIKGSKAFIQNVFSNREKLNLDLNPHFAARGKSFKIKVYASDINVPFGVEIIDISPKEIYVELGRIAEMAIPLKLQYIGTIPIDRKLDEVVIGPQKIIVSGPVNILKSIAFLETSPINLALFNRDEGSLVVSLVDLDPRLKLEKTTKIKLNYKTQLLNSKHIIKQDL